MLAELSLHGVRRFTEDLSDRIRRCDNGEGMMCSTLDEGIKHYAQLCHDLRQVVDEWARAIFTGQVSFDPEVEALLRTHLSVLLGRAERIAAHGRAMVGECVELEGLNFLHYHIADLNYLMENWVSPRLAVGPAPRVPIPEAAEKEIRGGLQALAPLPNDWRPTDTEQLDCFKQQ
jgi:hypothetical protein